MHSKRALQHILAAVARNTTPKTYIQRNLAMWGSAKASEWKRAVSDAEKIVGYPTSFMSLRCLLSDELANVAIQIRKLIGTKHPLLKTARGFLDNGKHSLQTRGLIVLLMSKAAGPGAQECDPHEMVSGIYPSQRTLAEITEMIHTANLIHKGVVNLDTLQPNDGTYKDMEFGNKIAVLSGDFLLANASTGLAELNNTKVVERISRAIADTMEAEFTNLRDANGGPCLPDDVTFAAWEKQTYLQSGSLLAKSCESALELSGHEDRLKSAAAEFGENVAYARQMEIDLAPFTNSSSDINGLLTTAPIIRHTEVHGPVFTTSTDPYKMIETVKQSDSLDWCIDRCQSYGHKAISAVDIFTASDAKQALTNIANATTNIVLGKS